jgi:lysophospholipase L1-like esterase
MPTRSGRPQALAWLVSLTMTVVLGVAVAEIGVRLLWLKRLTIPAGIEHPQFHHRLPPNTAHRYANDEFDVTIHTNSLGLRAPEPSRQKPPGTVRVLLLGDSFTFGFPVRDEETFAARIGEALRAKGLPVEILNGGQSGYSPTLHYLTLRDQLLAYEPDVVVLWSDLGDLQEDAWYQKNLLYDAQGELARCDPRFIHGRFSRWEWLRNHSALIKYLDIKLVRTAWKIRTLGLGGYLRAKFRGQRAKAAIAKLKAEQQAEDLASYDRFLLVRETSTEESVRPYWELSAGYLRKIHALLAARGVPLIIGIYPYGMLAGPDQWDSGRVFWGFQRGRVYDDSAVRALFARFAAEEGLGLIDTFDAFKAGAATQKLFYDEDGHMTPAGHAVLADAAVADADLLQAVEQARRRLGDPAPAE